MKKIHKFISCMLVLVFIVGGCESTVTSVSVTIYPIQYLVERIAGEYVEVYNLSDDKVIQAANINHNYESVLDESTTLFYISGLEPYFDVYQDMIYDSEVLLVDLMSEGVHPEYGRRMTMVSNGTTISSKTPFYEGDVFDNIDMYDDDPSFWMDPIAMIGASEMIKDYLVKLFPMYEEEFNDNFYHLEIDLSVLDSKYQELKSSGESISFVSMSPNFGTWQESYGFNVYPVCISKYGALPSDSQLEMIKERIVNDNVKYIVYEDNLTQDMYTLYDELVAELGLIEVSMYNATSIKSDFSQESKDYLTMLYDNLTALESMVE